MQLLELTEEEAVFLAQPGGLAGFEACLGQRLAGVLGARLRLPVTLAARAAAAPEAGVGEPRWQVDAALATLWLTRRCGGHRPGGVAPFVSASLIRTLDAALAEAWLGNPACEPSPLAWTVTSAFGDATLAVAMPQSKTRMARWAREVIEHA